jgi:hypothetical protein
LKGTKPCIFSLHRPPNTARGGKARFKSRRRDFARTIVCLIGNIGYHAYSSVVGVPAAQTNTLYKRILYKQVLYKRILCKQKLCTNEYCTNEYCTNEYCTNEYCANGPRGPALAQIRATAQQHNSFLEFINKGRSEQQHNNTIAFLNSSTKADQSSVKRSRV